MAKLIHRFMVAYDKSGEMKDRNREKLERAVRELLRHAAQDLRVAGSALRGWGQIPESFLYRNYNHIPSMLGLITIPSLLGDSASFVTELSIARRSYPKDDLFFREWFTARCWLEGQHLHYGSWVQDNDEEVDKFIAQLDAAHVII